MTTVEPTPTPTNVHWWRHAAAGVAAVLVGAGDRVVGAARRPADDAVLSVLHGRDEISQGRLSRAPGDREGAVRRRRPDRCGRLEQFRQDTAQSVAVGLVIDDAAADRGVSISDDAARTALTAYISSFYGKGTKPFGVGELLARVRANLRRPRAAGTEERRLAARQTPCSGLARHFLQ